MLPNLGNDLFVQVEGYDFMGLGVLILVNKGQNIPLFSTAILIDNNHQIKFPYFKLTTLCVG